MKFWIENPKEAAGKVKELFPDGAVNVQEQAEKICRNTFVFSDHWEMERTHEPVVFQEKIDWEFLPGDDPEWLYAMNRHTSFLNLAKAWLLTGDKKYAEKLSELFWDFITRVPLTKESKDNTWRSLEAGIRCENWLRCLGIMKGSSYLSGELRKMIEESLLVHGKYLMEASGEFHRLSNWGVLQDHGLFLLGVYFDKASYRETAIRRMDSEIHMQVMRDGSQWEQSPMYHCEVLHCVLDTLLIAFNNGIVLPERLLSNAHRMCQALAAWLKPNGRLFCQSDSDDISAGDILVQGAILFSDGYLKGAAGGRLFEENIWDFKEADLEKYRKLQTKQREIASTALKDSGNYVLRSDASKEAAYLHMHCGCLGSGHGHADLLHIDAGSHGEDILIDAGRYTYVNTPLRRSLKEPAAHNTTRVDGKDFSVCLDSWGYEKLAVPIKGEYCFTKRADYISGLHFGYLDLKDSVVSIRSVVFVKPDIFLIFDRFLAKEVHRYEQNFHFAEGYLSRGEDNSCFWQGEKAEAQIFYPGRERQAQICEAPFSDVYNLLKEGKVLTLQRQDCGTVCMVTALVTGKKGEGKTAEVRLLPVKLCRSKKQLSASQAQAVEVVVNERSHTVIMVFDEIISEVDYFQAGGYTGYGKVMVFSPQEPEGICLAW